jgi:hypothetical protein
LTFHDDLEHRQDGPLRVSGLGEVTIDYIAGEAFNGFRVAACGEILEGPNAEVTRCDTGQYGPGQLVVTENWLAD